jgi:hypothetical protein
MQRLIVKCEILVKGKGIFEKFFSMPARAFFPFLPVSISIRSL